jgi:hypothetical protein
MKSTLRSAATKLALFSASALFASAQTTVLTFEGLTSPDLLHGYGDRVDGPTSGGFTYQGVGTYTPNVLFAIGGAEGGGLLTPRVWHTGYSQLLDVAYLQPMAAAQSNTELQVTLSADPGFHVSLQRFDLGNYGGALTLPYIRAFDEGGALLHESLGVALPVYSAQARRFAFDPPLVGRIVNLRISLAGLGGVADNVGLDNFTFGQYAVTPVEIGANYCGPGVANSSVGPAAIRASGQTSVAANDTRLMVTGLPFGSVGFFMASRTEGFVMHPAGSAGNLCLGGAIGRFIAPGQVRFAGTTGTFALRVDLTQIPSPSGSVVAQPGDAWRFQAWYRDSVQGVAGSNFTDAVAITLN